MSLNDIVKGLYRGACALVASAAIYVGGCASDVKQPQTQQQEQPQSQLQVVPQSRPASNSSFESDSHERNDQAVIVPVIKFVGKGLSENRELAAGLLEQLRRKFSYPVDPWVEYDGFDGVFDDTFDFEAVRYYLDEFDGTMFDFERPATRSDSHAVASREYILGSHSFTFDSTSLRDDFVSRLSKLHAGYGFMIVSARKHIGADLSFQAGEVDKLVEYIQTAIASGKTSAGRGFVVANGKEDYSAFDIQVWNAFVSATYKADIKPNDFERLKRAFVDTGLKYYSYNAYAVFAHELDIKDGKADGRIGEEYLMVFGMLSEFDGKLTDSPSRPVSPSIYAEILKDFSAWPSYTPDVKVSFISKANRDRFVELVNSLEFKGPAIAASITHSGVDGILQDDEAEQLNVYLSRLVNDANHGTGGSAGPAREE